MASQGYSELNRIFWLGFRLAVLPATQKPGLKIIFNSLFPERSICTFENVIFNLVWLNGICIFSHDNAIRWKPQKLTDDKSTLVQIMAWCRQATSHYLSQYWPRFVSPYGVTRPQCVLSNMGSNTELLGNSYSGVSCGRSTSYILRNCPFHYYTPLYQAVWMCACYSLCNRLFHFFVII